jgi:hypothetical protein
MTENIARDYCGEALASAGVKSNGSASSDRDQSKNTAGGDNMPSIPLATCGEQP